MDNGPSLKFVIAGHVDHGKSTLIGRILYDTDSVPKDKIREVMGSVPRGEAFAHFLDSFKTERERNMTVDTTQVFFKTARRRYVIIDVPGHREFIKNMITGASYANKGVLVVDIKEGLRDETRRHASILCLFGIRDIIVAVNKIDLVGYKKVYFDSMKKKIEKFLNGINVKARFYIPVSALRGENIIRRSNRTPWHKGPSFLEAMDSLDAASDIGSKDFIFSVQDVYHMDGGNIAVGMVDSGRVNMGDLVKVLPGGDVARIKSVEKFLEKRHSAGKGESVGLTIENHHPLKRGDVLYDARRDDVLKERFRANIFLFGGSLGKNEELRLRCGTQTVSAHIDKIHERFDSATIKMVNKGIPRIRCLDMAIVDMKTCSPIVIRNFSENENLGRFVLERNGAIIAGGIAVE